MSSCELSQFEKMVEVTVWTNRLDNKLRLRLNDLKIFFNLQKKQLDSLKEACQGNADALELIESITRGNQATYTKVFPELTELCVVAADHVYSLDSLLSECKLSRGKFEREAADANFKLSCLADSTAFRLGRFLLAPFRLLRDLTSGKALLVTGSSETSCCKTGDEGEERVEDRQDRKLSNSVCASSDVNPYDAVENEGSSLSLFDRWNTVFHYQGKRFGSKRPSVTDDLNHLIAVHQQVSFHGKSVLEIGSFEGGNTKEMIDLGAKRVVGIEANRECFLKCLVVKNEFKLDNFELIYGDCNEILSSPRFIADYSFDICIASGVLYHMKEPLRTIDLLCPTAPVLYVWTQVASDLSPKGEWLELEDTEGRKYKARRNYYPKEEHWGGVAESALWLTSEAMLRAFRDRGFRVINPLEDTNGSGRYLTFIAVRS